MHGAVRARATSSARSRSSTRRYELATARRRSRRPDARALRQRGARSSRRARSTRASRCSTRRRASAMCGDLERSLGRARLLHHDQLVPGRRRLPPRGRVDGGGEPLVRQARRHGLPRRLPHPPRRGAAASRRLVGGRGAGARGLRGAPRLRPHDHRAAGTTRSARSDGGAATSREPRRRTASRTRSDASRSPASRSSDSPRARSTPPSRGSRGRSQDTAEPLFRFRRLPAQVEIAIAAGDLKTARAAADEAEQIVDSYKIGDRRARAFDATRPLRARPDPARREGLGRRDRERCSARATSGRASARRTRPRVRGCCSGTAYARSGDEHASTVELESALATFERLGARPEAAAHQGAARPGRGAAHVPVHGHRRLDAAARHARRRQVEAPARAAQRARPRAIAERGGEVVKQTGDGFFASFENPKAAIEAAVGDPALRSRPRSSRPTCGSARTREARSAPGGVDRLRRAGRARRVAHRCSGGGRRDPREHRDARRRRRRVPRSPSRASEDAQGRRAAGRGRLGRLALK